MPLLVSACVKLIPLHEVYYFYVVIGIESEEVKSSVGQPTTLPIGLPDVHKPDITWMKDGRPVNHPVLPDGSLFIINTDISDQGKYTVTVTSHGSVASENIQLTVCNPQLPAG